MTTRRSSLHTNGNVLAARHVLAVAVVGLALGVIGGCSGYAQPTITGAGARTIDTTADGVAMEFLLDVANSNDEGLPLRDVEYTLDIEGETVFRGTRSAEATASRKATQRIVLPAVATTGGRAISPGVRSYRLSGSMTYVTPGQFAETLFDAGVRVPSVGFATEGQIEIAPLATPTTGG